MTALDLTSSSATSPGTEPPDLQMRVKWHVVTAWLVAAMVGTNGYRIITTPENTASGDAQAIKDLRRDVSELREQLAALNAIMVRVERNVDKQQDRDRERDRPGSRMFDR